MAVRRTIYARKNKTEIYIYLGYLNKEEMRTPFTKSLDAEEPTRVLLEDDCCRAEQVVLLVLLAR